MEVNQVSPAANISAAQASSVVSKSDSFSQVMSNKLKVPSSLNAIFEEAAKKYNIPAALLKAVGKAESDFKVNAVSHCGAQGVMQLMPATARGLGVTDSFDPYQNIMGGAKYLSSMLKKYNGNVKLALAAYNAGSNNVDKYGGIPPFTETQNYVKKIMGFLEGGENLFVPSDSESAFVRKSPASSNSNSLSRALPASQPYGGVSMDKDDLYASILMNILNFDDFTADDYLLFLEFIKYNMQSSVSNTLGLDEDYERQSIFNNKLLYG